ncbi:MAG: hypothetical protein JRM77_08915 [Nitrososphaerota archaeon]|jgi:hypothetical protein|nr:hypothetical protein [Nitrososphaerota archaeon]
MLGGPGSPISEAAKGIALHIEQKVADYIEGLRAGRIRLTGDQRLVRASLGAKRTPEWKLFNDYIPDRNLRDLALGGLGLRELSREDDDRRVLQESRGRILASFGLSGLHVAQLAEHGLLAVIITSLVRTQPTPADVKNNVDKVLRNIDYGVYFVKGFDKPEKVAKLVGMRAAVHGPQLVLAKASARKVLDQAGSMLSKEPDLKTVVVETRDFRTLVVTREVDFSALEDLENLGHKRLP